MKVDTNGGPTEYVDMGGAGLDTALRRVAMNKRKKVILSIYRTIRTIFAAIEARATWPNTARSTRHAEHGARAVIIILLLILAAARRAGQDE